MSSLQEFLNSHPIDDLVEEVAVSDRFRDAEGNILKFRIKAMTHQAFDDIRKRSTSIRKGRKMDFDAQAFNTAVIIEHTLAPNFKDAASIQQLGCTTPEAYLNRVLLAGEITTLVNEIQKLSGFDTDMNELVDEAKN